MPTFQPVLQGPVDEYLAGSQDAEMSAGGIGNKAQIPIVRRPTGFAKGASTNTVVIDSFINSLTKSSSLMSIQQS